MRDRVYPPAFPVNGLGVYVHTGIYAPTGACGPVTWLFTSASGAVVFDGKDRGPEFVLAENERDEVTWTGVYFSEAPLQAAASSALASTLAPWIREALENAIGAVGTRYRERFPSLTFNPPFVVATSDQNGNPPYYQAEVANGGIIRFAFFNFPDSPTSQGLADIRGNVAHEFGHELQPESVASSSEDSDNLIHEGGAEYLRWTTMIQLGWLSRVEAAAQLDKALNACLARIGNQPWQNAEGRSHGDTPYSCGLALHVLILASRGPDARRRSADSLLESYYRRSAAGPVDFGTALECGESVGCRAHWTPALLGSRTDFAKEVDALVVSEKLALGRVRSPATSLQMTIASTALIGILDRNCSGPHGFYNRESGFEIAMSPHCEDFHDGMVVTQMAGIDLATQPLRAARATVAACNRRQRSRLGLADGTMLEVACAKMVEPADQYYRLDIDRVLRLVAAHSNE